MTVSIQTGDALACVAAMPANSVHCAVTSPPYWGLRDYGTPPQIWGGDPDCRHRWSIGGLAPQSGGTGPASAKQVTNRGTQGSVQLRIAHAFCARCGAWRGSLGLEPDYRLYVDHLVAVMRAVRRVLRPDGTLWLNLGDCYATGAGKAKRAGGGAQGDNWEGKGPSGYRGADDPGPKDLGSGVAGFQPNRMPQPGLKPKDLVGIPWRVAFALQDDGWWLRRDHIWAKPNPMPESCVDRCTTAHEYLFLLTKSARYYYDQEAIEEPTAENSGWAKQRAAGKNTWEYNDTPKRLAATGQRIEASTLGQRGSRHKRSVWTIATAPFAGPHFATFPPALAEPCILAGCPAGGTVLDPFIGSGTTALVADRLGRDCIGIDLDPAAPAMLRGRLAAAALKRAA